MKSINNKCSKYGSAYSQLDNKPDEDKADEDTTLQTALSNAADNILKNETIKSFYKTNKVPENKRKEGIKMFIKGFGAIVILITLFLESLDDYEWVCVIGKSSCGSEEKYNHLANGKLIVTIIYNLCAVCLHIENLV